MPIGLTPPGGNGNSRNSNRSGKTLRMDSSDCSEPETVTIDGPVEISNTCDNPVPIAACEPLDVNIVSSDVPQYHYEKSGYICSPDTETWVCELYVWVDGVQGETQVVDSGVPCDQPKPSQDPEIKELPVCIDGLAHIQLCQIVFENDGEGNITAGEPVNIGDPIPTGEACNVEQKVPTQTYCTAVNVQWVDNHSLADVPPGVVMYPQRDYEVDYVWSDGAACTIDHPATGAGTWGPNNDQKAANLKAKTGKDWERRVRGADGDLSTPYGSHSAVDCCPGDPVLVKVTAHQINAVGDRVKSFPLAFGVIEGEESLVHLCSVCGEDDAWTDESGATIEKPNCIYECGNRPAVPEPIEPDCTVGSTQTVCVATYDEDGNAVLVDSDIFLNWIFCPDANPVAEAYTLDGDGEAVEYDLVKGNFFANCDNLEEIGPDAPECPEGAVFNLVQYQEYLQFVDNQYWEQPSLPTTTSLTNANSVTIEVEQADGTVTTHPRGALSTFLQLRQIGLDLGFTVNVCCANWANCPEDGRRNPPWGITPPIEELFANGWCFRACKSVSPIVRMEVISVEAGNAAWLGAKLTPLNIYDGPVTKVLEAVTCSGTFYKDHCTKEDVAAPICCTEPYSPEVCVKPSDEFVEVCYCASALLNTGRGGITDLRNGPFTLGGISGDTWAEFETALAAAGYASDFGTQFDDVGNPIQDASLWMVCGPEDLGNLTYDSTLFEGGVTVELTWAGTKAQRVSLSKCDKDFFTDLLTDCDACPISVVTDTVCSDVEETFGEGKLAVVVAQGEPIIRKVITTFNSVGCECVEATTTVKLFNFLDPLVEFVTEPVGNLTECDSDTEILELCDRNGDPIQVVTITVNLPTGVETSVQYADLDGVPVPQPLLPLGVCNPDVEIIPACVEIKGEKVYGTIFAQMNGAGNPVISTSVFISNDSTVTQQVGNAPYELNCEPCNTTCTETRTKYCYNVSAFAFTCSTSTIVVDGEVIDLCGEDSGNGIIPSSGDLCTVGGVRSGQYANSERCRSAYAQPTTDVVGAAMELQTQGSIGATAPSLSQYTNVHIAVRGTFPISGTAPSIAFSATWNVGSGIAVGAYDCSTNTDLDLIGGTLNTYDTGACGVQTTRGQNDSWGASNNGINHTATFDTSGVSDLQDVVFYTIVMGSPVEWLSDIKVNGLDPAAQSCDITSVQTLADTLTIVTGTPWTIEGESVCTETDSVLGPLTCGETSVDPDVTELATEVASKRVQLDKCTLDALAAANPINEVITECASSSEVWYLLSKFRGTPEPHPDAASYSDTFVLISAEVRGEHPTVIDSGTNEPLDVSGYSLFAACATEKPADDSNGHEWFQVADIEDTTFAYAGQANPFPVCEGGEANPVLGTIGCLDQKILDKLCAIEANQIAAAAKAIAVLESCDGSTMYGIDCKGNTVWELPNPAGATKVAVEVKG